MSDCGFDFPKELRPIKTSDLTEDFFKKGDEVEILRDPYSSEKAEIVVKGRTRIKDCLHFCAVGETPVVAGIYKGDDGGQRAVTAFFLPRQGKDGVIVGVVQRLDALGRGEGLWESEDEGDDS